MHAAEVFTNGISGFSHWRFGNVDWAFVWRLAWIQVVVVALQWPILYAAGYFTAIPPVDWFAGTFGKGAAHILGIWIGMLTLTAIWQLVTLPAVPVYWRATHGDAVPHLSSPVSSIAHTAGPIASSDMPTTLKRPLSAM